MIKKLIKDVKKHKMIYLMSIPVLLYYLIFYYAPMTGLTMAFQEFRPTKGIWGSEWVGFEHFIDFFHDIYFVRLMRNTFTLNLYDIIISFPIPIIIALLLNELSGKFVKRGVQTFIYVPNFVSMVVLCGIVVDFCATEGAINDILEFLGMERSNLLQNASLFKPIFILMNIWQYAGWNSIVYMAAISGINTDLYDAAYVDGCGRWTRLWYVTLPGLVPTIITMFILRMGNIMTVSFEKTILLYNPLTYETADVISSYVYRRGIQEANYSYATAVGMFNSLMNLAVLWFANKMCKKLTDQSLW